MFWGLHKHSALWKIMMPTCSQREQGTKARIAMGVMKWTDVENCLGGCSVAASVGASGGGLAELWKVTRMSKGC